MQTYFALIGDIAASRRLEREQRAVMQRRLETCLADLNAELGAEAVAAPLKLTAGDEFQGLLARPDAVVSVVTVLADELFPLRMVFGVGRGELATPLGRDVARLDGPCLHRARNAVEAARRAGAWLKAEGFPDPYDQVISGLFQLLGTIRQGWTAKQALYSREARERLQKDVAARQGVSPSVVSESLKAANFDALREGEQAARALLGLFAAEAAATRQGGPDAGRRPTWGNLA